MPPPNRLASVIAVAAVLAKSSISSMSSGRVCFSAWSVAS